MKYKQDVALGYDCIFSMYKLTKWHHDITDMKSNFLMQFFGNVNLITGQHSVSVSA